MKISRSIFFYAKMKVRLIFYVEVLADVTKEVNELDVIPMHNYCNFFFNLTKLKLKL